MAKRSGSRRPSSGRARAKPRVATRGLKVTATRATAGRAATSVHVEVEADELKSDVGEFRDVTSVSASIPEDRDGRVHWKEERLQPAGTSQEDHQGHRRTVQKFFNVHYGPDASSELGVGVNVDTDRGRVNAPPPGHAYTVKDDSQPGESEPKKKPRR